MKLRIPAFVLLAAMLPAGASLAGTVAVPPPPCSGPAGIHALPAAANAGTGGYALPADRPTALAVFAHGYGKDSAAWNQHMLDAAKFGAIAVTPDYDEARTPGRGWQVTSGAHDLINAAKYFLKSCDEIKTVVLFGVSMGGNTSGLALAAKPKRADGSPLFNYWFDIEGVVNMTETYTEATAVSPANAYAARAKEDIEKECGGTIADKPQAYLERTVVARVGDIADSGVKGVVLVHGLDDGLVPHNQSREMVTALRLFGTPADMTTVVRRHGGEAGTTLTGNIPPPYDKPFAGHGAEESSTQRVIRLAHDRLHALLRHVAAGHAPNIEDHETIDDDAGSVTI